MLSVSQAENQVADLVARARKAGADAADALYIGGASTQVQMRLGALEDVERSEGEEIGLRVFVGQRSASASTSDLSPQAFDLLVERVVAMAREAPEDPYAALAPEERLTLGDLPVIDIDDGAEVDPAALRARALECEDAARSVAGVTNSEGAGASASRTAIALGTSTGFARGYAGTGHGVSASVLAGNGSGMQRDYAYHSARHLSDLDGAAAIGRQAGERAIAKLDPIRPASGPMPVVFDPRAGSSLLGHLIGAITGAAIARKTSFLLDSLGHEVFGADITIIDDPHRIRGLRSRTFDGEGLATHKTTIIDKGVLTGWLMATAAARQLGLEPTGHASRGIGGAPGAGSSNLHMLPGSATPVELMADIKKGIYVTELIGMGVNGVTGDYSRGAAGFLIENGELTRPVAELTVAGNLKDMYRALVPANDLEFRYSSNVPTLRVDGMTVAGG
ncbi:TldD/PmbA family protein [Sphingomonas sp. LaA6.9]|uniref:TldD/PmbA family protein n=1 Tax=Sphingomonas sp. LaA6.9 TaxID=2919914 RepID=UPI001F5024AD|nr:TldD/PmbA family protein [Sphingomonas sp. LaA6.9]MCJ8158805.1 TldD/PmbA family protein [Sphingomonas sp. LaA6.9]